MSQKSHTSWTPNSYNNRMDLSLRFEKKKISCLVNCVIWTLKKLKRLRLEFETNGCVCVGRTNLYRKSKERNEKSFRICAGAFHSWGWPLWVRCMNHCGTGGPASAVGPAVHTFDWTGGTTGSIETFVWPPIVEGSYAARPIFQTLWKLQPLGGDFSREIYKYIISFFCTAFEKWKMVFLFLQPNENRCCVPLRWNSCKLEWVVSFCH